MKKVLINLLFFGLSQSPSNFSSTEWILEAPINIFKESLVNASDPELKQAAFKILKAKCNVCHKKKNPFKIFSLKNMDRHAPKIYKQVFIYERMPKGNQVKLTDQEYQTLKNWLKDET